MWSTISTPEMTGIEPGQLWLAARRLTDHAMEGDESRTSLHHKWKKSGRDWQKEEKKNDKKKTDSEMIYSSLRKMERYSSLMQKLPR